MKKIIVVDDTGKNVYEIGDREEFKDLLEALGGKFLEKTDNGIRVVGFAALVDGGEYRLGPSSVPQQQQRLCLFEIVFQNLPTGSSGTPHIHADLEEFPMDELQDLEIKECGTPLYQYYHRVREGKISYTRELQVQTQLENVVKDVIDSCEYGLQTDTEAALNGLQVDVGFLRT